MLSFKPTANAAFYLLLTKEISMAQKSSDFGKERRIAFGHYLRQLRTRPGKKKTQIEVERRIGMKSGRLSLIETGDRPIDDDVLLKLAEEYDVALEELLRERYRPQLSLLDGIMKPADLIKDLRQDLHPDDVEEVTRYIAFLLLKRAVVSRL